MKNEFLLLIDRIILIILEIRSDKHFKNKTDEFKEINALLKALESAVKRAKDLLIEIYINRQSEPEMQKWFPTPKENRGPIQNQTTAHRCPVCNGNGLVPNGFYHQTTGEWSTSSIEPEMCQSCNGSGIVWG
ncbi:hypothetical protein [Cyclobacterium sp.]|uniref:hypothetical protein n=1 Tax=Cyclobacterium sp. TaxID=1966343 RepID=UPI00199827A8|nr:hypothetical protein [Cyclobacterium sp.]MBD3627629.1 hypothetical protein [Cyclobacterium sp.]